MTRNMMLSTCQHVNALDLCPNISLVCSYLRANLNNNMKLLYAEFKYSWFEKYIALFSLILFNWQEKKKRNPDLIKKKFAVSTAQKCI